MIDREIIRQAVSGIKAAEKLQSNYNASYRASGGEGRIPLLQDVLAVFAESYPGRSREHLGNALERSYDYCSQYRNMKKQFLTLQSGRFGTGDIAETVKCLLPILPARFKPSATKALLVLELLESQLN